jgi:hypothetical protein
MPVEEAGLSAIALNLGDGLSFLVQAVSVVVGHRWARYLRAAGVEWRKYMIRQQLRKPGWRTSEVGTHRLYNNAHNSTMAI